MIDLGVEQAKLFTGNPDIRHSSQISFMEYDYMHIFKFGKPGLFMRHINIKPGDNFYVSFCTSSGHRSLSLHGKNVTTILSIFYIFIHLYHLIRTFSYDLRVGFSGEPSFCLFSKNHNMLYKFM